MTATRTLSSEIQRATAAAADDLDQIRQEINGIEKIAARLSLAMTASMCVEGGTAIKPATYRALVRRDLLVERPNGHQGPFYTEKGRRVAAWLRGLRLDAVTAEGYAINGASPAFDPEPAAVTILNDAELKAEFIAARAREFEVMQQLRFTGKTRGDRMGDAMDRRRRVETEMDRRLALYNNMILTSAVLEAEVGDAEHPFGVTVQITLATEEHRAGARRTTLWFRTREVRELWLNARLIDPKPTQYAPGWVAYVIGLWVVSSETGRTTDLGQDPVFVEAAQKKTSALVATDVAAADSIVYPAVISRVVHLTRGCGVTARSRARNDRKRYAAVAESLAKGDRIWCERCAPEHKRPESRRSAPVVSSVDTEATAEAREMQAEGEAAVVSPEKPVWPTSPNECAVRVVMVLFNAGLGTGLGRVDAVPVKYRIMGEMAWRTGYSVSIQDTAIPYVKIREAVLQGFPNSVVTGHTKDGLTAIIQERWSPSTFYWYERNDEITDAAGRRWRIIHEGRGYHQAVRVGQETQGRRVHPRVGHIAPFRSANPEGDKHDYEPGDSTHPMETDPSCRICGQTKRQH